MNPNPTSTEFLGLSEDTWLLVLFAAAVLIVCCAAAWCVIENHMLDRPLLDEDDEPEPDVDRVEQLRVELAQQRQQIADLDHACRRLANLLGEQYDAVAQLKRQLKALPPARHRAIETTAVTAQLPKIDGRPVLTSVVVGDIKMSASPTTLRERTGASQHARR